MIEEYNIKITHISGRENVIADALSRIEVSQTKVNYLEEGVESFPLSLSRI